MHSSWKPPLRWVFGAATFLGFFSTLQAYRLIALSMREPAGLAVGPIMALNFAYWYIPAAFSPLIFRLVHRFRVDERPARALGVHAGTALLFAAVHALGMMGIRGAYWGPHPHGWWSAWQRNFLTNLDWLLMTYAALAGLTYAVGYYRDAQARSLREAQLQTRLAEARLKTLEAELHPHFLFNTLHAISTLLHSKPETADRMISRLSDLLRLTFDRSGAAKVPLQEELEFLQKYLDIEQIRFQDRLSVRYDVDPASLDAEVPRLILQPLVENAIKHGIAPNTGPGVVEICSRVDADRVWLEVRDNGAGLSGPARLQFKRGVGLSNTRARLDCLYGEAARLELGEGQAGLAVRIALPLRPSHGLIPESAGGMA
ncbi:MAG TPA: histidine kinase [Vicinamibacterales bacterium]|nr:histidine kinase [Vicinamibacterales bacterium]